MKMTFPIFSRRLSLMFLMLLAALILVPGLARGQAQSTASFSGTISTPPQVNATNFYNSGTWNISTATPYKTANTLNYTNVGTMNGSVGWEFDWGPTITGQRGMAASFYNDSRGTIQAEDNFIVNPDIGTPRPLASYLLVSATNIVNKGTLIAGAAGEMVLTASNVNLARSTLEIVSISPIGNPILTLTNFYPDTAIYDEYWAQTNLFPHTQTPYDFDTSGIWNGPNGPVFSPIFYVNGICAQANLAGQIGFYPSLADSTNMESALSTTNIAYTNADGIASVTNVPTKIFRQAVFVGIGDPNIFPADRFDPNSGSRTNLFQTITVKLTSALTGNSLYLADTLGALTNRGLELNLVGNIGYNPVDPCTDPTFRPANYAFSRLDTLGTFAAGSPGLGPPPADFFYDPASFTNAVAQADYSAYVAYVDDLARDPFSGGATNLPGKIVINAGNLDLTKATIVSRGSQIAIQANNFIGSTGAVVSCQNLSYNLDSASGLVNVTNLIAQSPFPALKGTVYAWSATWTNGMAMLITSYQTNGLPSALITNHVEMDYHVLLVDATGLSATVPVTVQDLILQTNGIVSDSMNVVHSFLCNGPSLTLLGSLNLSGTNLQDWSGALVPNLLYFTNNGSLSIPNNAYFGGDGSAPYAAFVNGTNGSISVGGAINVNSDFYQSGGNQTAPGGYLVTAASGKIEDGAITSGANMGFVGGFLKLDHAFLSVYNQLNLNLTNALYDSGGAADNTIICGNGFNLPVKPATGDLLGTAITAQAPDNLVDFVWAGENRGPVLAGFTNNVALGQLILAPQSPPVGALQNNNYFEFSGAGANNALYVDLLDLSQITNLDDMLAADPNLVIYYAAAKLPARVTVSDSNGNPVEEVETNYPLNGQVYYVVANGGSGQIPQEPEEVLNGQLDGHLRWVTNFAGPNSSVDVLINGQTYAVNRALRYSLIIDSNTNGVPNGVDPYPFGTPPAGGVPVLTLTVSLSPPGSEQVLSTQPSSPSVPALSWLATSNTVYQVQYRTNLASGVWQPLLDYTNTAPTNVSVTVWDTNAVSSQRYYRLSRP